MEINENLIIRFKGKNYDVKFPRIGEYRTIQAMKQTLSLNAYGGMSRSMMAASEEALDMIDIECYLTVLCPDLVADLKCEISELGLLDYTELREVFKDKFVPWWNKIEELLRPQPKLNKVADEETKQD